MVTKAQLETAVAGGCAQAECGHKHEDTMFLHSKCHTGAPQFLWQRTDGIMAICVEPTCNKPVFMAKPTGIKLEEGGEFSPIFKQGCHPDSAVQLSYTKGTGIVQILCYECDAKAGEMVIE